MSRAVGDGGACRGSSLALGVRFRYLILLATIFVGSFLILTTSRSMNIIFVEHKPSDAIHTLRSQHHPINSDQSYSIRTDGCSIPAMDPFDAAVKKYVKYPTSLKPCFNSSNSLLGTNRKKIWIRKENVLKYVLKKLEKSVFCCYQAFYRPLTIADITSTTVDDRVKYNECKYFTHSIAVKDEFIRVRCLSKSVLLYQNFFIFATKKRFMKHDKGEKSKNAPAYNVLVLGIDAVSRLNFYRTMPKTISYLKNKGAVDMMGYNKVGDNTYPNLVPMLMGIKDSELKKVCLPHRESTFDNCPFIWEWFKQAGYYTAFGEDSSYLGTFNYGKVGFSNTPTDYYMHTFINEAENKAGSNKDFNSYLCFQDKYVYNILLNYVENLTTTLNNSKLFGFFWEITMSHDHLNYPMVMDDDYVQFFKRLEANKYLNDTIVIMVSDHGIRWGEIRSTKQGRLEERLPFLFVLTPPSFRDNYTRAYDHLKLNSKRLTTPFDVYATLADLVDLKSITDASLLSRSKTSYGLDRGISLFLPVPYNRTCEAAGISDHWCTCRKSIPVSKNSTVALKAALSLVSFLNEILEEYKQCSRLSLSEILDIKKLEAGKPANGEVGWEEYILVARTSPGDGIFEATLRKDNKAWSLVGTVSRLNLYGEQSRCMNHYELKLYCYCE